MDKMSGRHLAMPSVSGRIKQGPSELLDEEVLKPQFRYESAHLLSSYLAIEKVFAVEYVRMGLISTEQGNAITAALRGMGPASITAQADQNMSDIAFAIEQYIEGQVPDLASAWHVDRSRNDFQACAQLMSGRQQALYTVRELMEFGRAAVDLARRTSHMPMPGYTHLQAAQVITPGFYFAAVVEQVVHSLQRLLTTYDGINLCPLGGGAMAGQEISWDRERMARLLGFRAPRPHALAAVASRDWTLELAAELALLGAPLSRFATDLMNWGGGAYGFIDLPDELSGISSAMPQKKNFPILERIRGKSAHLVSCQLDMTIGQRNTPYSNSVEVSKEAGAYLLTSFSSARSLLRLFTVVLERVEFREKHMREACEREYLGGFTLANFLTLHERVPWRSSQVIAGRYIVAAIERGASPRQTDPDLLRHMAKDHGFDLCHPEQALTQAFDVEANLRQKCTPGSVHPDAVEDLLNESQNRLDALATEWEQRGRSVDSALQLLDQVPMAGSKAPSGPRLYGEEGARS
ncbi:argininosuccinate lyase [Streptomyces bikiniensis]|uniref:argininosuccinate lyase n=1 Tax=Streptomyces bikiniensis TaxID=1896 RepID=A0ABW8D4W3_STRBI